VVTEIVPLQAFYPAEAYHQDYFAHNPNAGYCQAVINPKLKKLREHHAERIKASA
jgi:peptide-methionine (S)-S-oxide reductase